MERTLVGVDGSDASRLAVRFAADDARCRGATLTAVLVVDQPRTFEGHARSRHDRLQQGREDLDLLIEALVPEADPPIDRRVESGDPRRILQELSTETDQIIVGSRGRGATAGLLLGSVSQYLVTHAACPVTVTRETPDRDRHLERIVVGVDGSTASLQAVEWAVDAARCHGASLSAVIVAPPIRRFDSWQDPFVEEADAKLHTTVDAAVGAHSMDVERRIRLGDPRAVLEQLSAVADLLVVGSHGRGTVAGLLLGSVSQHLVTHAACPVTVVRPAPS